MSGLREDLHLDGPLPGEVRFEVILWPAFHPPLGVRVLDGQLELWLRDAVGALTLDTTSLQHQLARVLQAPPPTDRQQGRDGLLLLIRDAHTELKRGTASDELSDPALSFAADLVTFLRAQPVEPATARVLSEISRYLK